MIIEPRNERNDGNFRSSSLRKLSNLWSLDEQKYPFIFTSTRLAVLIAVVEFRYFHFLCFSVSSSGVQYHLLDTFDVSSCFQSCFSSIIKKTWYTAQDDEKLKIHHLKMNGKCNFFQLEVYVFSPPREIFNLFIHWELKQICNFFRTFLLVQLIPTVMHSTTTHFSHILTFPSHPSS